MGSLCLQSDGLWYEKLTPDYQKVAQRIFGPYMNSFMKVFLDDFSVFGSEAEHLTHPRLCLEKCREARLSLNFEKCAFAISKGILLGHVVSTEGLDIDRNKVDAIHPQEPSTKEPQEATKTPFPS